MTRGTTPTIVLTLDTDLPLNNIAELWVTFKASTVEVTKDLSEVLLDSENKTITVELSQEDTLKLYNGICEVQVRFRTSSDLAYATSIATVDVNRILKGGVI